MRRPLLSLTKSIEHAPNRHVVVHQHWPCTPRSICWSKSTADLWMARHTGSAHVTVYGVWPKRLALFDIWRAKLTLPRCLLKLPCAAIPVVHIIVTDPYSLCHISLKELGAFATAFHFVLGVHDFGFPLGRHNYNTRHVRKPAAKGVVVFPRVIWEANKVELKPQVVFAWASIRLERMAAFRDGRKWFPTRRELDQFRLRSVKISLQFV
mmetsp:Transcript_16264/g.42206  ORF Transcript_16264/g.42206 Transcript_16264/m.42206 type:complete len:209 (+) Transcript_16264:327-953(+)